MLNGKCAKGRYHPMLLSPMRWKSGNLWKDGNANQIANKERTAEGINGRKMKLRRIYGVSRFKSAGSLTVSQSYALKVEKKKPKSLTRDPKPRKSKSANNERERNTERTQKGLKRSTDKMRSQSCFPLCFSHQRISEGKLHPSIHRVMLNWPKRFNNVIFRWNQLVCWRYHLNKANQSSDTDSDKDDSRDPIGNHTLKTGKRERNERIQTMRYSDVLLPYVLFPRFLKNHYEKETVTVNYSIMIFLSWSK